MLTSKNPKSRPCAVCERVFVPESEEEIVCGSVCGLKKARAATGGVLTIQLPWPPKELSPNARLHWSKLAKAKKAYRETCAWHAKAQGVVALEACKPHISLTFFAPTKRAYDLDNALARMKAGLDGLADVLGVDDKHWSLSIARGDVTGGYVIVQVTRC